MFSPERSSSEDICMVLELRFQTGFKTLSPEFDALKMCQTR